MTTLQTSYPGYPDGRRSAIEGRSAGSEGPEDSMHSTKLEGFPEIGNEQYAVLAVERATGVVHSVRGERFVGHGERFLVFDTLSVALEYCWAKADSDAAMETTIFDCHGAIVDSIRPPTVHAVSRNMTTKKPWWRWW